MSQGDLSLPTTGVYSGLTAANYINAATAALVSKNSGSSAPTNAASGTPVLGQEWIDTSVTPNVLKMYDGSAWIVLGYIDTSNDLWMPAFGGGYDTLASGSTTDLGSKAHSNLLITGTTTISSFGSSAKTGNVKNLVFNAALQLTHSANLVLPTSGNITTASGDTAIVFHAGSGVWRVLSYQRLSGSPLISASFSATSRVLGRKTSGSGAAEEVTLSELLDFIGSAARGDVLTRGASAWQRVAVGAAGRIFGSNGTDPGYYPTSDFIDYIGNTRGDILTRGASAWQRLAKGAASTILTSDGTDPNYVSLSTLLDFIGSATRGDILTRGASSWQRLAKGSAGQHLYSDGTDPQWVTGSRKLLATLTASNSASLSDTSSFTSTFKYYDVEWANLYPANSSTELRLQVHSGGSFQTTSYITITQGGYTSGAGISYAPTTHIAMVGSATDMANAAPGTSGRVKFINPSAAARCIIYGEYVYKYAAANYVGQAQTSGFWDSAAAITGFRIIAGSGNITAGEVNIYGYN